MTLSRLSVVAGAALMLACPGSSRAQDVVKVAGDHNKILLENEHVRVIENTLAPGDKDALHTHPSGWYYVTRSGTMKVVHSNGRVDTWESKEGEGGWLKTKDRTRPKMWGKQRSSGSWWK